MNFIIVSRESSPQVSNLRRVLRRFGEVRVVEDTGEAPDGYREMCTPECSGESRVTAWDRAFVDIDPVTTWFVEDDVAGSPGAFERLFAVTETSDSELLAQWLILSRSEPGAEEWNWWYMNWAFAQPRKTFNPLCRLSGDLISRVLDFRTQHQKFCFHELMFASLASSIGEIDRMLPSVFEDFRYRPLYCTLPAGHEAKIVHPVKDPDLHRDICG